MSRGARSEDGWASEPRADDPTVRIKGVRVDGRGLMGEEL